MKWDERKALKHIQVLSVECLDLSHDFGQWNLCSIRVLINLLIENKLIISSLGNLHYKISREKFEHEPGFEPHTSGFLARQDSLSGRAPS